MPLFNCYEQWIGIIYRNQMLFYVRFILYLLRNIIFNPITRGVQYSEYKMSSDFPPVLLLSDVRAESDHIRIDDFQFLAKM